MILGNPEGGNPSEKDMGINAESSPEDMDSEENQAKRDSKICTHFYCFYYTNACFF